MNDTTTEPRHVLWHRLNLAITELQRRLLENNVIQAYFQWETVQGTAALLKNTETSWNPDQPQDIANLETGPLPNLTSEDPKNLTFTGNLVREHQLKGIPEHWQSGPMNLERAVGILNKHSWDGLKNWKASGNEVDGPFAVPVDSDSPRKDKLDTFVACAVAEKLERESK